MYTAENASDENWEEIDAKLAIAALEMSLASRKGTDISNLIHHSDQGVQYASWEYVSRLKEKGIQISMSD